MTKKRADTGRKIAAVLAGGLVLGIGAGTTMAAWTDSQQATATFRAGVFQLESKTTASGFDWKNSTILTKPQVIISADGMSPGSSSYGYIDVRTNGDSTLGGEVQLNNAKEGTGTNDRIMIDALQFRAKPVFENTDCASDIFDDVDDPFLAAMADPAQGIQTLQAGAGDDPGNAVRYCVEVRMKTSNVSNEVQGKSANLIWTVQGSSL